MHSELQNFIHKVVTEKIRSDEDCHAVLEDWRFAAMVWVG